MLEGRQMMKKDECGKKFAHKIFTTLILGRVEVSIREKISRGKLASGWKNLD